MGRIFPKYAADPKLLAGICLTLAGVGHAAARQRPNILFIMTDQQSWNMMSCMGNTWLHTPNMDRIAAQGYRFEKTYCVNPVSSPSRFSLLTGHYASEVGVRENTSAYDQKKVEEIARGGGLGHLFRRAGYETLYSGKTHLYGRGNTELYGFTFDGEDPYDGPAIYAEKMLSERAQKPQKQPFFLFLSFMNPHDICYKAGMDKRWPNGISESKRSETIRLLKVRSRMDPAVYRSQIPPRPANPQPIAGELPDMVSMSNEWRGWNTDQWNLYNWMYHRLTESVDAQVGRVLTALDRSGLAANTIVVFLSDHGDMNGAHGLILKNVMFEECQRVPFMFSGPGIGSGVADANTLTCNGLDFLPTVCDLAGIGYPDGLPGVSLRHYLTGEGDPPKREYIVTESYHAYQITDGRYKYTVYELPGNPVLLTDLSADPGETVDYSRDPAYDGIRNRLHGSLMADLESRGLLPLGQDRTIENLRKMEKQRQNENKSVAWMMGQSGIVAGI